MTKEFPGMPSSVPARARRLSIVALGEQDAPKDLECPVQMVILFDKRTRPQSVIFIE
ncbi:MAG: hypothetical protein KGM95_05935 [Betaproteobacteria bacterium]|nr:hypothetical protein [Betaproteobacteria bacterium]